jgi:protein tyrosine/serine phosphatase
MGTIFSSTQNTRPILEGDFRIIRSDVPTELSEAERGWLLENKITEIIDLRTAEEIAKKECPLSHDARFHYYVMPVTGGSAIPESPEKVSASYIAMADQHLLQTVDFILHSEAGVLYFCNAGKDRTGVLSAILLHKLGKSKDYIISDYMKSKDNLKTMLEAFAKQNPSVDINVITPNEQYIKEFLEWYSKKS